MVNIPEHLLQRSAEARAKALGISVEQALAEMKGESDPTVISKEPEVKIIDETPAPAAETPAPAAETPAPAAETPAPAAETQLQQQRLQLQQSKLKKSLQQKLQIPMLLMKLILLLR
jgi:hypothetical protein